MYYKNAIYREDLKSVLEIGSELERMKGRVILVTGASGLIGSFLVDALMLCNEFLDYEMDIFAMSRNASSLARRFVTHSSNPHFHVLQHDVTLPLTCNFHFDYIIHAASIFPSFYLFRIDALLTAILG